MTFCILFLVLSEGLPIPNTTCDSLYPGRTGSSKGTLESPDPEKSEIFRNWEGPLKCVKSLVPTDSQSLTLKVISYLKVHLHIRFLHAFSTFHCNFL